MIVRISQVFKPLLIYFILIFVIICCSKFKTEDEESSEGIQQVEGDILSGVLRSILTSSTDLVGWKVLLLQHGSSRGYLSDVVDSGEFSL